MWRPDDLAIFHHQDGPKVDPVSEGATVRVEGAHPAYPTTHLLVTRVPSGDQMAALPSELTAVHPDTDDDEDRARWVRRYARPVDLGIADTRALDDIRRWARDAVSVSIRDDDDEVSAAIMTSGREVQAILTRHGLSL